MPVEGQRNGRKCCTCSPCRSISIKNLDAEVRQWNRSIFVVQSTTGTVHYCTASLRTTKDMHKKIWSWENSYTICTYMYMFTYVSYHTIFVFLDNWWSLLVLQPYPGSNGATEDLIIFNAAISGCAKAAQWLQALTLFLQTAELLLESEPNFWVWKWWIFRDKRWISRVRDGERISWR